MKKTTGFLLRRRRMLIAPSIPTVASGCVASLVSATLQPVPILAQIEPLQAGDGDPSPSNVRALSGWPGLTLRQRGKNLAHTAGRTSAGEVAADLPTGVELTASMYVDTASGGNVRLRFSCSLDGSTQYINGTYTGEGTWATVTGVFPAGATNCRAQVQRQSGVTFSVSSVQVEVGTERTTYEPYQAVLDLPVTWTEAGTVYGGTLDVKTGVLTVTHGFYDASSATISGSNPGSTASFKPNPLMAAGTWYTDEKALCNVLPRVASAASVGVRFGANNDVIYLYKLSSIDASLTTRAAIEAWLATVGLTVTYPLAEPQTYQLTPAQLSAILGTNTVWHTAGGIKLDYKRYAWQE